ncbi:MAG: hypothetical protein WCT26_04905, partial [Candidatus Buchananbacteria bacterium]
SLQAMLIIYYYVLFLWVNGTVKPFQVAPVELVDYLLGKTIYNMSIYLSYLSYLFDILMSNFPLFNQ